jgi:hypothetical protein
VHNDAIGEGRVTKETKISKGDRCVWLAAAGADFVGAVGQRDSPFPCAVLNALNDAVFDASMSHAASVLFAM